MLSFISDYFGSDRLVEPNGTKLAIIFLQIRWVIP